MEEKNLDVKEVKTLINSLEFLEKQLPAAISRWRKDIKNCDLAVAHMSKGTLKELCESPGLLNKKIFSPLYRFLNLYIANREGRMAFTGAALDKFLKLGLRAIQRYTVVSDFFSKNPQYFVPNVSVRNFDAYQKAKAGQEQYQDYILTINERLIGCKDNLNFMFLKLLGTVKNLPDDLRKMKEYLEQQCLSMRVTRLKMK